MVEPRDGAELTGGPLDEGDRVGGGSATSLSQMLSTGWEQAVLARIAATRRLKERTYNKVAAHVRWVFGYFDSRGVKAWPEVNSDISLEWCWAGTRGPDGSPREPSVSTASNRQWILELVFEAAAALGAQVDPATAAGEKIKRLPPQTQARPLKDDELARVCAYADPGAVPSKRSNVVAVSWSGGSAAEAAAVRAQDIDLDAGTVTFGGPHARVCALDEWSVGTIARYLRANPNTAPDEPLCVKAHTPPQRATESVNAQLWKVFNDAGYARRADISGRSLRLTAACRVLEREGIESAARLLGSPSLDNTADALGYRWQCHSTDEPLGCDHHRRTATQPGIADPDTAPSGGVDG